MFFVLPGKARFCPQKQGGPLVKRKRGESALRAWLVSCRARSREIETRGSEGGERKQKALYQYQREWLYFLCVQTSNLEKEGEKKVAGEKLKWFASSENLYFKKKKKKQTILFFPLLPLSKK